MKKNNLVYAFIAVMIFVAIILLPSKNPEAIPVRWFGFFALVAGLVAFLLRDKKKVYKSGEPVIELIPDYFLFEKKVYYLKPKDKRETRQVRIERNNYFPELGTGKWEAVFLEKGGSKWMRTEYASTARELVPLAVRYIMRDKKFEFEWHGNINLHQWIIKK